MSDKYKQAFQEEARENLVQLESVLLVLSDTPTDAELVGEAFRALHPIKGSGMMFGFDEVAAFTHHIETAFDAVRTGRLNVTADLINLTLSAIDQIKIMLDQAAGRGMVDAAVGEHIRAKLPDLTGTPVAQLSATPTAASGTPPPIAGEATSQDWHICFRPAAALLR